MEGFFKNIWEAYKKRYTLYTGITAGIFLLQMVHLYWLATHVITYKILGTHLFDPSEFWQFVIIFVDYLEIPAILSASFLYMFSLRQKWNKKDLWLLILLNTQWSHIFWISDEFVESIFTGVTTSTILPAWLVWIAISIDYLELPVMYDTVKKFLFSLNRPKQSKTFSFKYTIEKDESR